MADIHLNKLGAASRLIDATVTMLECEIDELAIYVVASSARSMLRELHRLRGGDHYEEATRLGLFHMARDHLAGTLPPESYALPGIREAIEPLATLIEEGSLTWGGLGPGLGLSPKPG